MRPQPDLAIARLAREADTFTDQSGADAEPRASHTIDYSLADWSAYCVYQQIAQLLMNEALAIPGRMRSRIATRPQTLPGMTGVTRINDDAILPSRPSFAFSRKSP